MNKKLCSIELDVKTANRLTAMAEDLSVTVGELVAELAGEAALPKPFEKLRNAGWGVPAVLADDAPRAEAFEHAGKGVPQNEVRDWMRIWGTARELPMPNVRKVA